MFTIDPRQAVKVAIPDTGQKTLFLDQSDSVLKTKDDAGVVESLATTDTVQDALDAIAAAEPKVYIALLTQTGTNAPVATVLKNTLGGEVVWSRTGMGTYEGTLTGAFVINKTTPISKTLPKLNDVITSTYNIQGGRSTNNTYVITTGNSDDGINDEQLQNVLIKIEVYP